jgi:hypothetical protein
MIKFKQKLQLQIVATVGRRFICFAQKPRDLRKTYIHLSSQEILGHFLNAKVDYRIYKSSPLDSVLSQMNPVHISDTIYDQF